MKKTYDFLMQSLSVSLTQKKTLTDELEILQKKAGQKLKIQEEPKIKKTQ